jgi:hypothetical protein
VLVMPPISNEVLGRGAFWGDIHLPVCTIGGMLDPLEAIIINEHWNL